MGLGGPIGDDPKTAASLGVSFESLSKGDSEMVATLGVSSELSSKLGNGEPKSKPGLGGVAELGAGLGGTVRGVGEAGSTKKVADLSNGVLGRGIRVQPFHGRSDVKFKTLDDLDLGSPH